MRLEIETPEELEAARKAVEELRARTVRHVGLYADRMNLPCEQTTREKAFADHWRSENEITPKQRDYRRGILENLLCVRQSGVSTYFYRDLKPEESIAAATVVQWLGTHCGWCFLEECVKTAGYRLVREDSWAERSFGCSCNECQRSRVLKNKE